MSVDLSRYRDLPTLLAESARRQGSRPALIDDRGEAFDYATLDATVSALAARLATLGVVANTPVAVRARNSAAYVVAMLAILRAGGVVVPLPVLVRDEVRIAMLVDSGAKMLLDDVAEAAAAEAAAEPCPRQNLQALVASARGANAYARSPEVPRPPTARFAIIYSSGTTGTPKGIVHSDGMRFSGITGGRSLGIDAESVVMISTPLYSNTSWVTLWPALALGACCVLMEKFETTAFLALSARHRVTHAMLVPTQYARLMADPAFDRADLSSYQVKLCTSAPFSAALKAQVLARWPGKLIEFYGLTEGGGVCMLAADECPDKLHSVGRPLPGHVFRLIDDDGNEVSPGERGEIVSRSPDAIIGYHGQDETSRSTFWFDSAGHVYLRTGDIGEFDADGYLSVVDRKKDMIIRGGFNLYPRDIEQVLLQHPAVVEAAVIGVPDAQWGEVPVAHVVLSAERSVDAEPLREWANARLGAIQRLSRVVLRTSLPRNPLGKVLKRSLREELMSDDCPQGPTR